MSASIWINLANGQATGNMVFVALANAAIAPTLNGGVSVQMASAITNISVTAGQIAVATGTGARFDGSIKLVLTWNPGVTPTITLNNLAPGSGPATATWPTASGPAVQVLTPGDPLALSNIVSS